MPTHYKAVTISLPSSKFHQAAVKHARSYHGMSLSTLIQKLLQESMDKEAKDRDQSSIETKLNKLESLILDLQKRTTH